MKIYKNSYEERLYSTGNDDLDDLLERAFCDGYEYAQREFARYGRGNVERTKRFLKKAVTPAEKKLRKEENRALALIAGKDSVHEGEVAVPVNKLIRKGKMDASRIAAENDISHGRKMISEESLGKLGRRELIVDPVKRSKFVEKYESYDPDIREKIEGTSLKELMKYDPIRRK